MLFLKKFLLGLGALVLILVGGSGTQSGGNLSLLWRHHHSRCQRLL